MEGKDMFIGTTLLSDPTSGSPVATFTEMACDDGDVGVVVTLTAPITLLGTENLAIYSESNLQHPVVITISASDPAGTSINQFGGQSAIGSIPNGTAITLVKSPGGRLGTLLEVIGKGTIVQVQ
jgi:hypothetical protein